MKPAIVFCVLTKCLNCTKDAKYCLAEQLKMVFCIVGIERHAVHLML